MEQVLDQSKSHFRLNNFVLWTKGWYKLKETNNIDDRTKLFKTLKKVLALDDFLFINSEEDIVHILSNNIRYYNEWAQANNQQTLEVDCFMTEVFARMRLYDISYFEAMVYYIREFFAWRSKINLHAPIYNSKITKFGLVSPLWTNGMTYAQLNRDVMKMKFLPSKEIDYFYLT